jgi:hypothetical protein
MSDRSFSMAVADDSSNRYRIIRLLTPRTRVNATGIGSRSRLHSQRSSIPRR